MFKASLLSVPLILLTVTVLAQKPSQDKIITISKETIKTPPPAAPKEKRYKDMLFNEVMVDKDISYSEGLVNGKAKSHVADIYQASSDLTDKRPLIIWMHGGGFKFGSKDAKNIEMWCRTFAQRGYVCASINYTLSKKDPLFHFGELQKSTYYAVQDCKMAINFFRNNAAKYRIDPNMIILAGNSAGGIIALQTAYASNTELSQKVDLKFKETQIGDNMGMTERPKIAGVINFWGGIFDLGWLRNARVPIAGAYGTEDPIIAPDNRDGVLFGALAINREATALGIPNAVKFYQGYSHELQKHFNPIFSGGDGTEDRWLDAGQFAADFLYDKVLPHPNPKKTDPLDNLFGHQ